MSGQRNGTFVSKLSDNFRTTKLCMAIKKNIPQAEHACYS
jgi:hypothetical protein